jgi:hypothetical protein
LRKIKKMEGFNKFTKTILFGGLLIIAIMAIASQTLLRKREPVVSADEKKEINAKALRDSIDKAIGQSAAPIPVQTENAGTGGKTMYDAYGMSCEYVVRTLGASYKDDFKLLKSESMDYGKGEWLIVGTVNGHRWVSQIKYYPATGKWGLVYPIAHN